MNDPRDRLTPEIQREICSYIIAGGFGNVAAEAAGVPAKIFERWMQWGQAERPVGLYREFYLAVRRAEGQARLAAESRTFQKAALSWFSLGTGTGDGRGGGMDQSGQAASVDGGAADVLAGGAACAGDEDSRSAGGVSRGSRGGGEEAHGGRMDKDPAAEAMMEGQAEEMKNGEPRTENRELVAVADGGGRGPECGATDGRRTDGSGEPSYKGNGDRAVAAASCAMKVRRTCIETASKR